VFVRSFTVLYVHKKSVLMKEIWAVVSVCVRSFGVGEALPRKCVSH
jgi:hypothetical protein